ncbi:hypothetical protein M2138_001618 [Dysgonomonadaceae bacterium PH5-43]|nr:hypothetical protein [Dysgonomonadaceae bacterium PH5-43]
MKNYNLANNILGWIVFAIAAATYLLTIEPTASFWDCGEFIVSAYKLEVGHPPGAPIFMLMGNLFSHFASEPSQVPVMLNAMSALFSAFTILFLFWTITYLAKKIVVKDKNSEMTLAQKITILGAGAVGALAYTFSDTFWFSAVEGEVYAFSSMMTAVVFWLILKWDNVADEPYSNRWLILIAYLIGVSVAIHLLNLLCIPAIVLVYYFRKNTNPTWKGALVALLVSFGILAAILYGVVQGLVEVAGWFELFFVNILSLPYNSGVIAYMIILLGVLSWAIWETMRGSKDDKKGKIAFVISVTLLGIPFIGNGYALGIFLIIALTAFLFIYKKVNPVVLNTILVGLFVITIGYSSYAVIVIRSLANTPMDQNSPEDVFTLRYYLSREQYGETPLLYGPTFVSEYQFEGRNVKLIDEGPIWSKVIKKDKSEKDRYYISGRKEKAVYVDELNTFFPRMYSNEPQNINAYKEWTGFQGKRVRFSTPLSASGAKTVMKPTFGENLKFFFNYQVNFMYWRYFMWNFAGRQNDIPSNGEVSNGNWITGIKFIDEKMVGPQDNLPDSIAKNKGHNKYYMLPLLLGVLGIFFQIYSGNKGTQQFWVTFFLFFMTGLAIVLYLNQPPFQPRERDYAYAGSFYAFCIWIGLGSAAIVEGIRRYAKQSPVVSAALGTAISLLIPIQMVSQTWDDHDRSGRYVARDFGMNYLSSCEENAIIFTNGDNDTFPLWYAQEVEGYRTDVRVCNLSYLQTDWYIDQMKRQAYESEPLPISFADYEYAQGVNDYFRFYPKYNAPIDIDRFIGQIKAGKLTGNEIPTYKISIPVDSTAVIASGLVKPENADLLTDNMILDFGSQTNEEGKATKNPKEYLTKNELVVLDMLRNNKDWSRPVYFAMTVGTEQFMRLDPYFRQDGIAFRVMPFETKEKQKIDTDILYDNVMNKFKWGNLQQPGLYIDDNCMRMVASFRSIFADLANALIEEEKFAKAKEVLDRCMEVLPEYNAPYNYNQYLPVSKLADAYLKIGEEEKAEEIYTTLGDVIVKNLNWYNRLGRKQYATVMSDAYKDGIFLQDIIRVLIETENQKAEEYLPVFSKSWEKLNAAVGRNR